MISILRISPLGNGDTLSVTVESDGEKNNYVVSTQFYMENHLEKGYIDEALFEDIENEDRLCDARNTAIRILRFGQCSKKNLYDKLRRRGFPHECAKSATDFVEETGYIDEDWQIENYLKTLVQKKYFGRRKIIPALAAKGYSSVRISELLDENYTDEDFKKFRTEFLLKKFGKIKPDTPDEAAEMKKALYKQGY